MNRVLIWGLAAVVLMAMDAASEPALPVTVPVEAATPAWAPEFIRVDVAAGATRQVTIPLHLAQETTLLAADTECRCVALVEPTPRALPAGDSTLTFNVVGLLPGVKMVTLRTVSGKAVIAVQVAVPGAADGQATLNEIATEAAREQLRALVIVHDLRGRLANCGCATGSLGGVGALARLPATMRNAGFTATRWVLTGDIDGSHSKLGDALREFGWEIAPADVLSSANPAAVLSTPGVLAVIDTSAGTATPAHQRIVRSVLDGGATAVVLLLDANGNLRHRHVLPIDRSLAEEPGFAARFREPQTLRIVASAQTSTACQNCHATEHAMWSTSAHARAWASLTPEQHVDACVTCHSTPLSDETTRAPAVGCTSCHQGGDAHAAQPTMRTAGLTDCRSCHDALHHPGFDHVVGWVRIHHGKRD